MLTIGKFVLMWKQAGNKARRVSWEDLMMSHRRLSAAAIAACSVLALCASPSWAAGGCELTGTKGSDPITPVQPHMLTVETALPSPGWWNGDTPDTIKDGYEYCLAANIAYRAGLD